jgi:natural product biosynthesis luciferase-like monooxygenase protein/amino acid adenylation domain-containing protein/FkbM family methyltransferase
MTIVELLTQLRSRNIKLWVADEQLCYSAPRDALTPALHRALVAHKAEVLAFLRHAEAALAPTKPALLPRTQGDSRSPVSFAQQRLWLHDQLIPDSSVYIMATAVRFDGALHVAALAQSLAMIMRRHESLRTTFIVTPDGELLQEIHPFAKTAPATRLQIVDLCALPAADRERALARMVEQASRRPFDLARGPLLRTQLLRLGQQDAVLLLAMHHIVSDGWSMRVLVHELMAHYNACRAERLALLPDLPIQFADYACWQRDWLRGAALEQLWSYWKEQLAGDLPVLRLPHDRPRPVAQTYHGASYSFTVAQPLREALEALSQREGCTLFMTLLMGFQILLARYSGQADILVGTPTTARTLVEIEGLIGCFVNTLVLRTHVAEHLTGQELLSRVRQMTLNALAHQDMPFEELVVRLQPTRDQSYSPLFQVLFDLQDAPAEELKLSDLTAQIVEIDNSTAKFDLSLIVARHERGLSATLRYNTDLFAAATIARMAQHWLTLLEGLAGHPAWRVAELPLLTAAELRGLAAWSSGPILDTHEACFHQLFEAQVARTPGDTAVEFATRRISYRTLNARANQLAHVLQKHGVGPEVLVALCIEPSIELLIGLLGVLKAGGAYVPLDPNYPRERLSYMVADAATGIILTTQHADPRPRWEEQHDEPFLPAQRAAAPVWINLTDWDMIAQESELNPASLATPASLAYLLYTSGSTGQPKGVLIEHRSLVNYLGWVNQMVIRADLRIIPAITQLVFDASLKQLLAPLLRGDAAWIIPAEVVAQPARLLEQVSSRTPLGLNCVPSLWSAMLDAIAIGQVLLPAQATLHLLLGGEQMSSELVAQSFAFISRVCIWNVYGPTETTANACFGPVTSPDRIVIGRPIANTQIYILDSRMRPVAQASPGELYIGGIGVARGYHNRPALTAERFVPNPFSDCRLQIADCRLDDPTISYRLSAIGYRLYRTGDLARWLPDGNLEFLGRVDEQVKLRGFRIELGEIEAVIGQHPAVRTAVVLLREDVPGEKRLVAYVVVHQATAGPVARAALPDPRSLHSELRSFLRERLPDYMLPAAFVVLDALPKTANGKIDRRALPAPDQRLAAADDTAARTPIEQILVDLWADLLGIESLGITSNFFEWGGHSLLATQMMARLRSLFGIELSLRELFEAPTIETLAELIEAALGSDRRTAAPRPQPILRDQAIPLSFAQQRIWFLDRLLPGAAVYHLPAAMRLRGPLDMAALRTSLGVIIARHDVLRTTFAVADGQPVQLIGPALTPPLPLLDLQALAPEQREATAQRLADLAARWPFDLSAGPLIRTVLVRLNERDHLFLITLHHAVADGWSIGVLIREISALYPALRDGQPAQLPALPLRYADYAIWQRDWLRGATLETQLAYWRTQLAGAGEQAEHPILDLPLDRQRPAAQTFCGARHALAITAPLTQALRALSQQAGVTLFMTLLAAFQTLLYRYSGQDEIIVGSPVANRRYTEIEGVIGCFINMLVLRGDLAGNPTFYTLLDRVRETALGAYTHQDLPFELLVEALQPTRDLSRNPLFQVMFVMQTMPQPALKLPGLTVGMVELAHTTAQFDLSLDLQEARGRLVGRFEYSTDLFDEQTIARMSGHFVTLLESIVGGPERRLAELALLSAAERRQVLVERNATALGYPAERSVQRQFEDQAAWRPDTVALVFECQQLTYAELNRRANQLGRYLRRCGVRPGALVAICVKRSFEMVIGLLGILKAGAAYVPLDPSYPQARLAFMLADTQVSVLLSDSVDDVRVTIDDLEEAQTAIVTRTSKIVHLAADWELIAHEHGANSAGAVGGTAPCYVIYTSGSTGQPKGVMVSHRNVVNFFAAMDERIGADPTATWLATTSISFDISVLELLWPLARGQRVVVQGDQSLPAAGHAQTQPDRPIDFSLFYFANDESWAARDKYRLLLEGARFADQHGFAAVWTPERHFHAFGGLYPNPSVTSAAIAAITERIQIRAGSVVLPLHNPVRVAEEWSVVDNLSNGRVGLSFASGWHTADFALMPERYGDRKQAMLREIETVRRLWRGESIELPGGTGTTVNVQVMPRPIQPELPIWLTAAGNPETFRAAGALGANVLTHLLGQGIAELAEKIAIYRESWRRHSHGPGSGHVTLMLHTFVGAEREQVRELVRAPFCSYLRSSLDLVRNLADSAGQDIDAESFTAEDMDLLLSRAFERYFETSALFGTPDTCLRMVDQLSAIGVDEIACLIDFGVDVDSTIASLDMLDVVRRRSRRRDEDSMDYSLPAQMARQRVTHMQCTPALAQMLTLTAEAQAPLRSLRSLLVGGETLPIALMQQLGAMILGPIHNMYGPTETTIWSTTQPLDVTAAVVPIGRPIANTTVYILDRYHQPVPTGVAGELWIGGDGVAHGYLNQPALTAERFQPDAFAAQSGARRYRTSDRARARADGMLELLGRLDHQVKIRGHRIEPGEIEAVLRQHPAVRDAVVVAREDIPGDRRLIAYVVPAQAAAPIATDAAERLLAGRQRYLLPDGRVIAHLGDFQTSSLYRELFTDEIYLRHGITLNDGDCVFDVGANIGLFTLFVAQRCPSARIYAFEPIPPTCAILRTNAALHQLDVRIFECGISDQAEQATFTFYPQAAGLSGRFAEAEKDTRLQRTLVLDWLRKSAPDQLAQQDEIDQLLAERLRSERYDCTLRTLSEIMREQQIEQIDLLKIDVEESELKVLSGIDAQDWRKIKQIVIEVHTRELLEQIVPLLKRHRYQVAVDTVTSVEATTDTAGVQVYNLYAIAPAAWRVPSQPLAASGLSAGALRSFLQARLPAPMVPAAVVLLDALPMTPNGKLDRRALQSRSDRHSAAEATYVAPQSETERRIATVWEEILGRARVGVDDNFFEVGGNSLLLVQVHSRLRGLFNTPLKVADIFRYPTISALAQYLTEGRAAAPAIQQISERSKKQAEANRPTEALNRQRQFMQERRQKK